MALFARFQRRCQRRCKKRFMSVFVATLLVSMPHVVNSEETTSLGILPVFSRSMYETRMAHMIQFLQENHISTHQFNDICTYISSLSASDLDLYITNLTILAQLDPARYQLIIRSSEKQTIYLLHKKLKNSDREFSLADLAGEVVYLPSPLSDTTHYFYHHLRTYYPDLLGELKLVHSRLSHDRNLLKWLHSDAQAAVTGSSAYRQLNEAILNELDIIPIETPAPVVLVIASSQLGDQKIKQLKQVLLRANTLPDSELELQALGIGKLLPVDLSIPDYLSTKPKLISAGSPLSGC